MPARLPPDLLDRSADEASRLLSLSYLDQIDRARARLGDALDQEALHDFRVGVRRLRSAIRAYRGELDSSVPGKMRRRLRDLARSTNDGRDVEVQLDWLARQAEMLGTEDVPGYFWLAGRLEDRKTTHDGAAADVARRYDRAAAKLRKALGILRIDLQTGAGQRLQTFSMVTGGLLRRQVIAVRDEIHRIRDAGDAEQAHRTRISLKRLRYLLEPIARRNRRAGALVRRFKEAQDLLGEHHDMHVLAAAIASFRDALSAGKFPQVGTGLASLARLADSAAQSAFERFYSIWGGDLGSRILARTDELGQALELGPSPVEPTTAAASVEAQSLRERAAPEGVPPLDTGAPESLQSLPRATARGDGTAEAIPPETSGARVVRVIR